MKILFDIVIVSYNAGDKLCRTLQSVLTQEGVAAQNDTDYRVIVKDGASTDASGADAKRLLDEMPEEIKQRVRLLQEADAGIYDAMNRALDALSEAWKPAGEAADTDEKHLVYFINCGDTLASDDVLRSVADGARTFYNKQETVPELPAIFYGDVIEDLTGERVASNPRMDDFALYRHVPCHQACFYDAALFVKERFDTSLRVRADYDHFLKSFYHYHALCIYLPLAVAHYEGGGFSETEENRKRSAIEHRKVLRRYMDETMIRRFDRRMKLTLQPLRTKLAENPETAGFYNALRRMLYRMKGE